MYAVDVWPDMGRLERKPLDVWPMPWRSGQTWVYARCFGCMAIHGLVARGAIGCMAIAGTIPPCTG